MRILQTLGVLALVLSIVANVMLWQRNEKRRPQVTVNGQVLTKKDYHDWLEQHDGPTVQALMVKHYLVMQAADKEGAKPDDLEVQRTLEDAEQANPQTALAMKRLPWRKADATRQVEDAIALANLRTKDIKATDDELKQFYGATPTRWDRPDKFYTRMIRCDDPAIADKVKQAISGDVSKAGGDVSKALPDLMLIPGNMATGKTTTPADFYPYSVRQGGDGSVVLRKPFGAPAADAVTNAVATMKPGEVRIFPAGGNARMVVLLEKREDGKHGTLDDPDVRKRVERDFKLTRAVPEAEEMQKLWDAADIQVETPELKDEIKNMLLPTAASQRRMASAGGQ